MTTSVIFVHGLYHHSFVFYWMKRQLSQPTYDFHEINYPTYGYNPRVLIDIHELINSIDPTHKILFIAHSMGGLVVRKFLEKYHPERNIHVITLGTPHQGSDVARLLHHHSFGKHLLGTATKAGLLDVHARYELPYPLTSLAGVTPFGIINVLGLSCETRDSDGTVFVDETQIDGAQHHIFNNVNHTALLYMPSVIHYINDYLHEKM